MKVFPETYEVVFDYQKPDGYWVFSHKEEVDVSIYTHQEKKSHDLAAEKIKNKYPNCTIKRINYC